MSTIKSNVLVYYAEPIDFQLGTAIEGIKDGKPLLTKLERRGQGYRTQTIYNSILPEVYPEAFELIDEKEDGTKVYRTTELLLTSFGKLPDDEPIIQMEEDMFKGQYRMALGWGSAIKEHKTFLMSTDIPMELGLLRGYADAYRVGTGVLNNAHFGAKVIRNVRVMVVREGYEFKSPEGVPLRPWDGWGFYKAGVLGDIDNDIDISEVPLCRGSYSDVVHFHDTPALRKELAPIVDNAIEELRVSLQGEPTPAVYEEWDSNRVHLMQMCDAMKRHKFVKQELTRLTRRFGREVYLSGAWRSYYLKAMPLPSCFDEEENIVISNAPVSGNSWIFRYPIQSDGSYQPTQHNPTDMTNEQQLFADYCQSCHAWQYRAMAVNGHGADLPENPGDRVMWGAKGMMSPVSQLPEDVDFLFWNDDIKIGQYVDIPEDEDYTIIEVPAFLIGMIGEGKAIGAVQPNYFKEVGGDFDGDDFGLRDGNKFPEAYRQVCEVFSGPPAAKIEKNKYPIEEYDDNRWELFKLSTYNWVGLFTNSLTRMMSVPIDQREEAARAMQFEVMHTKYGELSAWQRAVWLHNFWIQVGTDVFKGLRAEDIQKTKKAAGGVNQKAACLRDHFKDGDTATVTFAKWLVIMQDSEYIKDENGHTVTMDSPYFRSKLPEYDLFAKGHSVCDWIGRKVVNAGLEIKEDLVVNPLNVYVSWGDTYKDKYDLPKKDSVAEDMAATLSRYAARKTCQYTSNSIDERRAIKFDLSTVAHRAAVKLANDVGDNVTRARRRLAVAMWQRTHSGRISSPDVGALVFWCFYDECVEIVAAYEEREADDTIWSVLIGQVNGILRNFKTFPDRYRGYLAFEQGEWRNGKSGQVHYRTKLYLAQKTVREANLVSLHDAETIQLPDKQTEAFLLGLVDVDTGLHRYRNMTNVPISGIFPVVLQKHTDKTWRIVVQHAPSR